MTASPPGFLEDARLRLLLFGGKGGVGKTTCAAATALHLARQHPTRSFLLVSTDPAHSLADCFAGCMPVENLTLCEINPQESLARFKAQHHEHLRTIALRGTFLDQADVAQLLDLSVPGLDEVMALLEIVGWVREDRYACVVVDTAPAGHTLRLLELPDVMQRWLTVLDAMLAKHRFLTKLFSGTYRKDAADRYVEETAGDLTCLWALLKSSDRCRFVPVMLAEALSLHVTRGMVEELVRLQLPMHEMVVNRLGYSPLGCSACATQAAAQAPVVTHLARTFPHYAFWGLPLFLEEPRGTERLLSLWEHASPLEPNSRFLSSVSRLRTTDNGEPRTEHPAPLPASSTKLFLFAGKGGVGKTTLACASALRLAEEWRDKETLLFSIDPAHSLSACLGCMVGPREVRVARGLTAIEIDAQAEYARLKRIYADELAEVFDRFTGEAGIDITFDREVMERLMDMAPPGLDEMVALTRIIELLDQGRYDLFILDTAPTGHLLRFLEMPELIEAWLRTFFGLFLKYRKVFRLPKVSQAMVELSKRIKQFRLILADQRQAALVAVTIPTQLAYEETKDLVATCQRLQVTVPILFVNMVTGPYCFLDATGVPCLTCSMQRHEEMRVLQRLKKDFAAQHRSIVFRQQEPVGIERLRALGRALYHHGASSLPEVTHRNGRTLLWSLTGQIS